MLPCKCDFHGSWCFLGAGEFWRKSPQRYSVRIVHRKGNFATEPFVSRNYRHIEGEITHEYCTAHHRQAV
jgi:hypothetical protein